VRLILASASPRRAELLRAAGYEFETLAVDVDERVHPGETPEDYVRRLAMEKSARAVDQVGIQASRTSVTLGADTAVVVESTVLGKPGRDDEARWMLRLLSGRQHRVLTGISLRSGSLEVGEVEATTVWFAPLTERDIDWYLASGEGRDKAGGYAIQGFASRFIPRIEGSYSNVVGLPVHRVGQLMTEIADALQRSEG
jgi:septum formation protein